ncbi:MAG: hypothetical protein ACRDNP_12755 [Gaiellaceae bacterium]
MLLLALSATAATAAITTTINPANAPSGTHLQTGAIGCSVASDGLTVSCSTFELAGVGHTNANLLYEANYTAIVDCFNPGANRNNPIESHVASFTDVRNIPLTSTKNGRLAVPAVSSGPETVVDDATCPNPNWDPVIREGTLVLQSFTYSLTFEGFTAPYILITGP